MSGISTVFNVTDNSGAKKVRCFKVLNGMSKTPKLGNVIVASVIEAIPNSKVKKGEVIKAVVVRLAQNSVRKNGMTVKFGDNAVVLITNSMDTIGTRVLGPIAYEVKVIDKFKSIASKAPAIY